MPRGAVSIMLLQILLIVALVAFLFPAFRRRLKGVAGLVFAAFLLFTLVVTMSQ